MISFPFLGLKYYNLHYFPYPGPTQWHSLNISNFNFQMLEHLSSCSSKSFLVSTSTTVVLRSQMLDPVFMCYLSGVFLALSFFFTTANIPFHARKHYQSMEATILSYLVLFVCFFGFFFPPTDSKSWQQLELELSYNFFLDTVTNIGKGFWQSL